MTCAHTRKSNWEIEKHWHVKKRGCHVTQHHVTQHGCTGKSDSNRATLAYNCHVKGKKVIKLSCDIGQLRVETSKLFYQAVVKSGSVPKITSRKLFCQHDPVSVKALPGSGMSQIESCFRKLAKHPCFRKHAKAPCFRKGPYNTTSIYDIQEMSKNIFRYSSYGKNKIRYCSSSKCRME